MNAAEVERTAHAATIALAEFDRAGVTTVLQTVPPMALALRELLAAVTASTPPADDVRDGMAKAMCAVETRSKAATLEEVQSGIQRWTRHRYEAECLIAELADYGLALAARGARS